MKQSGDDLHVLTINKRSLSFLTINGTVCELYLNRIVGKGNRNNCSISDRDLKNLTKTVKNCKRAGPPSTATRHF